MPRIGTFWSKELAGFNIKKTAPTSVSYDAVVFIVLGNVDMKSGYLLKRYVLNCCVSISTSLSVSVLGP